MAEQPEMNMWVCFWTMTTDNPNVFYDSYVICDDQVQAQRFMEEVMERDSTYAAGIGPIINSTEHWHVGPETLPRTT